MALEWSQINHVYGNGGLEAFHQRIDQDLATISALLDAAEFNDKVWKTLPHPEIGLQNFIDSDCLKISSRICFDYSFVQSSWFRRIADIRAEQDTMLSNVKKRLLGDYYASGNLVVRVVDTKKR